MAIKVQAMADGEYGGHLRIKGTTFFLVDIKHPETGEVLRTAEECFSDYKTTYTEEKTPEGKVVKVKRTGWMKKVHAGDGVKTPQQLKAEQEAEEIKAQEKADAELLAKAEAAGQADASEGGTLMPGSDGKMAKRPKAQGASAPAQTLNAADNGGKSQGAQEVL